jgi:hypothetical protein
MDHSSSKLSDEKKKLPKPNKENKRFESMSSLGVNKLTGEINPKEKSLSMILNLDFDFSVHDVK